VITVNVHEELTITVKMITLVMNVMSNVQHVQKHLITVLTVQKTESRNLNVYAHQEP
jgi:hypothetical protein